MIKLLSALNDFQLRLIRYKSKSLILSAISGFFIVLVIVLFVFIPTEKIMAPTGYTIFNMQLAWSKNNVDAILISWDSILDVVIYQTIFDYLFIIGNMILFSSTFLLFTKIITSLTYQRVSKLGMWFSVMAGTFDSIENIFTLMILTNPANYPEIFPILQSFFATIKFLALGFEVLLLLISLFALIFRKN